jgi:hypothetical protein
MAPRLVSQPHASVPYSTRLDYASKNGASTDIVAESNV